jgi:hypothetical protein
MPQISFGRKGEPVMSLRKSDDLIAVRTLPNRAIKGSPVRSAAEEGISDGKLVMVFPEADVEVYKVPTAAPSRSMESRKEVLRSAPEVRFAGGVLVEEASGQPLVYTENIFIKFVDGVSPDHCREVIREAGLVVKKEVEYAKNAYFTAAPEGTGTRVFDIAYALLQREDVEYSHPEVVRERRFRAIPAQQWHLNRTTLGGVVIDASANVEAAHQITAGEGTIIAVIDDGVDIDHPDFSGPGKIVAPRDVTQNSNDPRPKDSHPLFRDNHGTACAGVACASGMDGASGVAPSARLMPIRLASALGSEHEAEAFRWAADQGADVISCSWGPSDGDWWDPSDPVHNFKVELPASTRLALEYATKGCVVLFAAGNGNEPVENDGYASFERVIAVAACNDQGKRSVYSDFGSTLWCSFPSGDREHAPFAHPAPLTPGIWTTDRSGKAGYNSGDASMGDAAGDYTNDFSGTSSSCPGAAGVAALVLSVNPDLTWQDVRAVLRECCDPIDPGNGSYDANGHSRLYGFGRLNAQRAVQIARALKGEPKGVDSTQPEDPGDLVVVVS